METAPDTKDDSGDTCVICLSEVTERAITVPCNHYTFDFICLVSWLQQRSTCPLCKTEITAVQYDWLSPTDFKSYTVRRTHQLHHAPQNHSDQRRSLHAPYDLPRRPRNSNRPYEPPQLDIPLLRRRYVYRHSLYSLHIGSNPFSRYTLSPTPSQISTSSTLQSKARTFIRRELRVFAFLYAEDPSNAEFLLSYTVAILKKVDIKASNAHAEDLLQEYLGRGNARLFLHELNTWMRSPYQKLKDWDENVQYEEELPESFDDRGMPVAVRKVGDSACAGEPGGPSSGRERGGKVLGMLLKLPGIETQLGPLWSG